MLDLLKTAVEKTQDHLENIVDKIEDEFEDLSEEASELWQDAKPRLRALNDSLASAASSLRTHTDEARLQAHLATMDAHDQWSYLQGTVTALAQQARDKGRSELQYAELQAHLAKMDARDFVNNQGQEISRDYRVARETVEQTSQKAAQNLERSLENIGKAWTNTF
jgi:arsenate reductase-like glutaredoxin family protein